MIYTAVKNFDRALYFFEVCISTPAAAMSHIMLEAYKKFVLVSLILHGKVDASITFVINYFLNIIYVLLFRFYQYRNRLRQ